MLCDVKPGNDAGRLLELQAVENLPAISEVVAGDFQPIAKFERPI